MKRVVAFAQDASGCYWYRLKHPSNAINAAGEHEVVIVEAADKESHPRMLVDRQPGRPPMLKAFEVPEADVVVLQRPLRWEHWACIPFMQAEGVRVVVELDDDFENLKPNHAAWRAVQPKFNWECNKEHLKRAIKAADALVVATPALAEVYGQDCAEVRIVPNYLPAWFAEVRKPLNEPAVVGWSGTVASHPNDLKVMGNAVSRIVREGLGTFSLVGDSDRVKAQLGIRELHDWGWKSERDYPLAMGTFDIGIVPLERSAFNNAKSALKVLTNAALGNACVASPTDPILALSDDNVCGIAHNQVGWYEHLAFLCRNRDAARELGARARETFLKKYTMEQNAWRFAEAWIGEK